MCGNQNRMGTFVIIWKSLINLSLTCTVYRVSDTESQNENNTRTNNKLCCSVCAVHTQIPRLPAVVGVTNTYPLTETNRVVITGM